MFGTGGIARGLIQGEKDKDARELIDMQKQSAQMALDSKIENKERSDALRADLQAAAENNQIGGVEDYRLSEDEVFDDTDRTIMEGAGLQDDNPEAFNHGGYADDYLKAVAKHNPENLTNALKVRKTLEVEGIKESLTAVMSGDMEKAEVLWNAKGESRVIPGSMKYDKASGLISWKEEDGDVGQAKMNDLAAMAGVDMGKKGEWKSDEYGLYHSGSGDRKAHPGGAGGAGSASSKQQRLLTNDSVKILQQHFGGRFEGGMWFPDEANKELAINAQAISEEYVQSGMSAVRSAETAARDAKAGKLPSYRWEISRDAKGRIIINDGKGARHATKAEQKKYSKIAASGSGAAMSTSQLWDSYKSKFLQQNEDATEEDARKAFETRYKLKLPSAGSSFFSQAHASEPGIGDSMPGSMEEGMRIRDSRKASIDANKADMESKRKAAIQLQNTYNSILDASANGGVSQTLPQELNDPRKQLAWLKANWKSLSPERARGAMKIAGRLEKQISKLPPTAPAGGFGAGL